MNEDLRKRTKQFALRVVRIFVALPKTDVAPVLGRQVLRSGNPQLKVFSTLVMNAATARELLKQACINSHPRPLRTLQPRQRMSGSWRWMLADIEAWAQKHMRGTEAGEQEQIRAIRQSIRRVLENLEQSKDEVWRAFAQHLDKHLWKPSGRSRGGRNARVRAGLAGRFIYEPPTGVKWTG